jgi:hypothetical protein
MPRGSTPCRNGSRRSWDATGMRPPAAAAGAADQLTHRSFPPRNPGRAVTGPGTSPSRAPGRAAPGLAEKQQQRVIAAAEPGGRRRTGFVRRPTTTPPGGMRGHASRTVVLHQPSTAVHPWTWHWSTTHPSDVTMIGAPLGEHLGGVDLTRPWQRREDLRVRVLAEVGGHAAAEVFEGGVECLQDGDQRGDGVADGLAEGLLGGAGRGGAEPGEQLLAGAPAGVAVLGAERGDAFGAQMLGVAGGR